MSSRSINVAMAHFMDMTGVMPGDGYSIRKGDGDISVSVKSIVRVGGVKAMVRRLIGVWLEMGDHYQNRGWSWYDEGNEFCVDVADCYGFTVWQVAQVVAVLSPQNPWEGKLNKDGSRTLKDGNRLCTLKVIQAFCDGGAEAVLSLRGWGYAPMFLAKAIRILQGEELDWSTAPKTHRFALLLANPKRLDIAVCDSHASRIATGNLGGRYHVVMAAAYGLIEKAYKMAARILKIPAYVLQAGTWEFATNGGLY